MKTVHFQEELARTLPPDIPHRDNLIVKATQHLRLLHATNEHMNLTRITDAHEAAIKHVYDSVAPWRFFQEARHILDAGTGAGFPGIPLAIILPNVRFTLVESVQKKARFVDATVEALELPNAHVKPARAEEISISVRPDIIAARAMAPLGRLIELFRKDLKRGTRLLLYKGPDVENELTAASTDGFRAEILDRYELPDGLGARTLVDIRSAAYRVRSA